MKIALLAHHMRPIESASDGMIEMTLFALCKRLRDTGHKVDVFAGHGSDAALKVVPIRENQIELIENIQPFVDQYSNRSKQYEQRLYANIMGLISKNGYDLIHSFSLHELPLILGNYFNIPMITTIHTQKTDSLLLGLSAVEDAKNHLLTMACPSLREHWKESISDAEIIPQGIDLSQWVFKEFPAGDYVFWQGDICEDNGTARAIQTAIKSDHKLILSGNITDENYYQREILPLLNHPAIGFVGPLKQDERRAYLQNAKVSISTCIKEKPCDLSIAESLACGTPVVAYDYKTARTLLDQHCGVIVPTGGLYSLVKAVHSARKLNRRACRKRAEEFCSHKTMISKYMDIYEFLIERISVKKNIS